MASMIAHAPSSPRELPDLEDCACENEDLRQLQQHAMPEANEESWIAGYKMLYKHSFVILLLESYLDESGLVIITLLSHVQQKGWLG